MLALIEAGQAVRVLTRDPGKAAPFGPGVQTAAGDLGKAEILASALESVQALYLISQADQVNGVLAAARQAGSATSCGSRPWKPASAPRSGRAAGTARCDCQR